MIATDLVQVLLSGIALGSVYTLLAMGLFLTYATSRALNFGQGDFLALAAFLGMAGMLAGMPLIAVVIGVAICMAALGMLIERFAVRRIISRSKAGAAHLGWILSTLGFGMMLQNVIALAWGKSRYYSPPLFSSGEKQLVSLFGAGVFLEELAIGAAALVLAGTMYVLLYRSDWGRRVAAVSFDRHTAMLLGIDVKRTVMWSYVVMALLTGAAGLLVGPLSSIQSHMGMLFLLKAFAAISIGGFTNPAGLLIGGIAFGVIESLSNYVDSTFGDLYPFIIVLLFLIVRPMGLFGERKTDVR
ncbi:MAG: branched-chain amino acid ABC transporter permease [Betaproteobacteria bacterium]|nr:branched-chain amino acid ABC transporter permease [Betaproteobacteria bacterium]